MLNPDEPEIENRTRFADHAAASSTPTKPGDDAARAGDAVGAGEASGEDESAQALHRDLFETPRETRGALHRGGLSVLAIVMLTIGIALIPFPVIPGFPLILGGAILLAASNSFARVRLNRAERWLPNRLRRFLRTLLKRKHRASKADERGRV